MFRKGDGLILRMWLDQLILTFASASNTLAAKFINLARSKTSPFEVRFIIECLVLRALRSKNSLIEYSLLVALRNSEELQDHSKAVE